MSLRLLLNIRKILIFTFSILYAGCGTIVGNPEEEDIKPIKREITISSELTETSDDISLSLYVDEQFSMCIVKLKYKIDGDESENLIDFNIGFLDLANEPESVWGSIQLEDGDAIKEIQIITEGNFDLCGVNYSISYNDISTDKKSVLKWKFDPAITITEETESLVLNLDELFSSLKGAYRNGELSSLDSHIDKITSKGKAKSKQKGQGSTKSKNK